MLVIHSQNFSQLKTGEKRTNLEVVRMGKNEDLIEFVEKLDPWKITRDLKWRPRYSFEEGIKKTVGWYLSNEWWKPLVNERVLIQCPGSWSGEKKYART